MGTSASAVEETPLLAKTNKNGADNTNTETLDDAGEDAKEFYEDGAPLNRRYAMTHKKPGEGASTRSVKRMRRNILLLVLLSVVFVLLVSLCYVEYRRIQAPKRKAHAIEVKIKEHAAAAAIRFEQCHNTDWQTACDKLANAGARRQRNLQEQEKNGIYNTINTETVEQHRHHKRRHPGIDYETSLLMDHDEIAVTYDNNCLRVYRLSMFDDTITFPYYANQLLRAGGNYTMALFIQHGALRNAPDYFCSFKKLMRQQMYRPFEEILIIAPDFNYGKDALVHPNDAIWNSTKPWGDWRVGAESDPKCCGTSGRTVSSFDVLDHMLTLLMDQSLYPKLKKISFLGHSAGTLLKLSLGLLYSTISESSMSDLSRRLSSCSPTFYKRWPDGSALFRVEHSGCSLGQ